MTDMNSSIIGLWMGRVHESGAAIADRMAAPNGKYNIPRNVLKWLSDTICDCHCQLSPLVPDWTTELDSYDEREPYTTTHSISSNIRQRANSIMCPYDGIRRGFLVT